MLKAKTAAVVGLGGLGGHIAEQLARIGIGNLILIDGDKYSESNLNRQLFAAENTLGKYKVEAAAERLAAVNPNTELVIHAEYLTAQNSAGILSNADIVADGTDNKTSKLLLEKICAGLNITLAYGSCEGFFGRAALVMPSDGTVSKLYGGAAKETAAVTTLAFTAAATASVQTAEIVKYLLGRPVTLSGKVLCMDLSSHEYKTISLK